MGLSCTISEINGDFRRKSPNFPTPLYFAPLLKGFPLELGISAGVKKLEWWATGLTKKFDDIFSRLDRMHEHDRQTVRQTPGHSRPRWCIAPRGKNANAGIVWHIKAPNNCRNQSKGSPLWGNSLLKSGNLCHSGSRVPTPMNRMVWNFVWPSGPICPLVMPKFHGNRCNESPLWGENADFWPVSKFSTSSLPLYAGNNWLMTSYNKPIISFQKYGVSWL